MRIVVTGGSGFIGRAVVDRLRARRDHVVLISRARPGTRSWNDVDDAIEGADAVVHLAGESIAARPWTPDRMAELRASRLDPTQRIARAIAHATARPRVLVSASAVGIYGTRAQDAPLAEDAPAGVDALARLCVDWEAATEPARAAGTRVVLARFGIVLGADGGALPKMLTPFRFFVGGPLGDGLQVMSWVHVEDAARATIFAIDGDNVSGPLNIVAPGPATMNDFARTLGKVLRRPSALRLPGTLLRVALGRGRADMILGGQRVIPSKLIEAGFSFEFPDLQGALADIVSAHPVAPPNPPTDA